MSRNVVQAVLASMRKEKAVGQILNVDSGHPTSIIELTKAIINMAGGDFQIPFEAHRTGDIKESFADFSKARKILNYEPNISLQDGLRSQFEEVVGHS